LGEYDNDPAKLIDYENIQNNIQNDFVEHGER
jgi:hypothetical protein